MPSRNFFESKNGVKYLLKRSNRRSVGISIASSGEVTVTVPNKLPLSLVEQAIEAKSHWIFKKLEELAEKTKLSPEKYGHLALHLYLGKPLTLKIVESDHEKVEFGENLTIYTKHPTNEFKVKHLLEMWYLNQASSVFRERLDVLYKPLQPYNIRYPNLNIVKMRGKWGQCNTKNAIKLNPNLIKTPIECIDYVIVHELCHLLDMSHNNRFYSYMTKFMPDWKKRKKMLDSYI